MQFSSHSVGNAYKKALSIQGFHHHRVSLAVQHLA
ncbi:Uncharacterised protein [Vibrio cholerae]|nr:Uncharacterised protein [Vibrio cholerae]